MPGGATLLSLMQPVISPLKFSNYFEPSSAISLKQILLLCIHLWYMLQNVQWILKLLDSDSKQLKLTKLDYISAPVTAKQAPCIKTPQS